MIVFFIPISGTFCASLEAVQQAIRDFNLDQLAADLKGTGSLTWPALHSDKYILSHQTLEKPNKAEIEAFSNLFLGAVQARENSVGNDDIHDVSRTVCVYGDLIVSISDAGGFANVVLSDSLYRIITSRLANFLIHHPEEFSRVRELMNRFPPPPCNAAYIGKIVQTETGKAGAQALLANVKPSRIRKEVFRLEGSVDKNGEGIETAEIISSIKTRTLIGRDNASPLVWRILGTGRFFNYTLSGFVDFLSCGGKIEDLYGKDVEEKFRTIMSKERRNKFKFEYDGYETLLWGDLKFLIEIFGGDYKEQPFYRWALD
jgi:hypothetical protein